MKKPAPKPGQKATKRTQLVAVTDWLKKGPLTAALMPEVRSLKDVIHVLRHRGWPIVTTLHEYYDQYGVQHTRAEYRLSGNWANRPLPFGGLHAKRSQRKNFYPPAKAPSNSGDGVPERGRQEGCDLQNQPDPPEGREAAGAGVPVHGVREELEGGGCEPRGLPQDEASDRPDLPAGADAAGPGAGERDPVDQQGPGLNRV